MLSQAKIDYPHERWRIGVIDLMEKEYLIVGGHRNGEIIKTNGIYHLRLARKTSTVFASSKTAVTHIVFDEYKLVKLTFEYGTPIEYYQYTGLEDKDAVNLLVKAISDEEIYKAITR